MKIAKADPATVRRFEELLAGGPDVRRKLVFGNPAAFAGDRMFFGVYGESLFLRLGPADREEALAVPGAHPFEPMPGRAMREFVVLPPTLWKDERAARGWVERARIGAAAAPPKPKRRPAARRA